MEKTVFDVIFEKNALQNIVTNTLIWPYTIQRLNYKLFFIIVVYKSIDPTHESLVQNVQY